MDYYNIINFHNIAKNINLKCYDKASYISGGSMRYNNEISGLIKNPRYKYALQVFHSLLNSEIPEVSVLKKLYKNSYAKMIEASKTLSKFDDAEVRPHDINAPKNIGNARILVGQDKKFQNIQDELLRFTVPEPKLLKRFFGEYSTVVSESYKLFIDANKKRKSGISMTCHHNRVACTFFKLNEQNPEVQRYTAIAALHDFIEDLMYSLKDENGERYTIETYQRFIDRFLPEDLQEPVKLLTNHYDMILQYVDYHLDRQGRRFNKDNVLDFLKNLDYETYTQLKDYVKKIIVMIENFPYTEMSSKNYLEEIKWECYSKLYIPELVNINYIDKENLLLSIKIIDLSDNNNGLDSVDLNSKIKNIRKSVLTGTLIIKRDKTHALEPYVREIIEDALVKAEFLVINDLMQQESVQDFYVDALVKIERMRDVFYK